MMTRKMINLSMNQSINQSKFILRPFKIPTQRRSRPRPSGREQSLEGGGIVNRRHLEGALDLLEVHSRFLDQPQKMNESALPQSGRMGPPNYREQKTGVYDDLHMRREGSRARAGRRAPSQTSTATPRTRSCKRCAVGMEASAIVGLETTTVLHRDSAERHVFDDQLVMRRDVRS